MIQTPAWMLLAAAGTAYAWPPCNAGPATHHHRRALGAGEAIGKHMLMT